VVVACLAVAGCAAPFGVRHASPNAVYRSLSGNVLTRGELSNSTEILLRKENLAQAFGDDPEEALRVLRGRLQAGLVPPDALYGLAELSFEHAVHGGGKPHFLASAAYAYAFAFPDDPRTAPSPYDARLRVAMDLYNRALTEAFKSADGEHVDIAGGVHPLPFGEMAISFDDGQLRWGRRRLVGFSPTGELEVHGFRNRYRQSGIGAPLAAATVPLDPAEPMRDFVAPHVRVPVTALLRLPDPRAQVLGERLVGALELHTETDDPTTRIDGAQVPLEQEPTVALALTLSVGRPWRRELAAFLGSVLQASVSPRFGGREPHRRGRIPVVFVHGTASNPSVWANMLNDLDSDPVIRTHFEFWFFTYDSGQPILYSGMLLRRALTAAVDAFSADGPDACLDRMVVIGHSQGGLLTKLTAIDSGDRFWRNVSDEPIDQVVRSDESRALLQEAMFVRPLPFVNRVVFIATPHRGSYLAGPALVRRLAQRLITLPGSLLQATADVIRSDAVRRRLKIERLPTSIDNMSPGHPFIRGISQVPLTPGIAAHSIIGVVGSGPREEGADGVVEYRSAHIDGVESELVVPYGHSMQAQPEVVAELQRILHHHLDVHQRCAAETPAALPASVVPTGLGDPGRATMQGRRDGAAGGGAGSYGLPRRAGL